MEKKVIAEKLNSIPTTKRVLFPKVFAAVCNMNAGKMKYVPIEGVNLEGFDKKLVGTNEELYLDCLVDAISITSGIGGKDIVSVGCEDSVKVASLFGAMVNPGIMRDNIISKWYNDILDGADVEKDGRYSEEDEYDENDFDEDDYDEEDVDEGEWEKYDEDDEQAEDEEEEDDTSKRGSDEDVLREELKKVFNSTVISLVSKVKKRYDLLFESGYDLERPYGLVSEEGILYTDSDKVLKLKENPDKDIDFSATMNIYELFTSRIGFNSSDARSSKVIAQDLLDGYLQGENLIYFPYKLLEYAYGRNPSSTESRNYAYATIKKGGKSVGVSTKWGEFGTKIIEDIKLTIEDAIVTYCLNVLKTGYDRENIRSVIRTSDKMKEIKGYIEYVADSLSVCVIIIQYKSSDGKPVMLKMRVCDPHNHIGDGMTAEIVTNAFSGNTGGSEGVTLKSGLNYEDSIQYGVFEYGHEFNHALSNAMPLFAYKAFEKLKEKGESISYKDLILGQSTDGTILRNGTHGLVLDKKLFHYINAGSRSGKGVMTLNMVAAALLSNKALIYLDNKPDMVSMLSELSGGVSGGNEKGPLIFGLNGSNNVDDKQKQFTHEDDWISRANIPIEAVALFGEPSWKKYGEIFYMRAFTLAFGIILARGLDGGHGKMNDPAYNGKDGIFLVCDETNVLQENFKIVGQILADKIPLQAKKFLSMSANLESVFKEANSENARKGADLKYGNAKRDFEEAFSAYKFYALSYLNTLSDNIAYTYQKSLAGFLPKEAECSDVVIIGQNLEQIPIAKDTITSAVSSGRLSGEGSGANGLGGTQIAKDVKGAKSIPLAHFVFSSADALIGYNSLHPEYLAQADSSSKAFGRLDLTANNFCYLPNFKISASSEEAPGSQLTKGMANSESSVYFKPYLILNNASPAYTSQMFDRVRNSGLTEEDVIREYPNEDGTNVSPYVGFPEYMGLMGVSDIPERLKKGAEIANMVVGSVLGYQDDGSGRPLWLQFVTDLRPEWMVSVRDIACLCGGLDGDANITKGRNNPLTKEYYDYLKYVSDHQELGIVDNTMSSPDAYFTDEDGNVQYDISGYESKARRDFYATDDGSDEEAEDEAFDERMQESMGDNQTFEDDEVIDDMFGDDFTDINSFSDVNEEENDWYQAFNDSEDDNVVGNKQYDDSDDSELDEKDLIIAQLLAKLQENGIDVGDLEGYSVGGVDKGVDCGYSKPDYREEFNAEEMGDMQFDEDDDDLTATTFANLISLVTKKVITTYGGYNRISTFRVIGGAIVVNGTVFRSKISKDCLGILPLDIRRQISSGNLAELFDYRELYNMPNLRGLEFDSVDFVYDNVSRVLGYGDSIGVDNFFNDLKSLQMLIIGRNKFTRQNYKQEMQKDDIFYYQGTATKYATVCDNKLSELTNRSWCFTKNMFNNKNKGIVTRTFGVLFGTVASATTGVATLGAKAVKGVTKKVDKHNQKKSAKDSAKSGFKAFKEGFKDLFNE